MNRLAKWCFVAVFGCVLFLSASEAFAYGCWVCENQLSTCLYYREQTKLGCDHGCDQMYPARGTRWSACRTQCTNEYTLRYGECYAEREQCYEGCPENERPKPDIPDENCPIVLDLGANGWAFTTAETGVPFDIDGDGRLDPIAWTSGDAEDAFLALDRNGNGRIDSGLELFGNHTAQPASDDPHGFLALAEFDRAANGGNGDGVISALDRAFGSLVLWVDRNHNGASEPGELDPLRAHGVVSIDLDFKSSRRKDPHGNVLRYRSGVELEGKKGTDAVDVFFRRMIP